MAKSHWDAMTVSIQSLVTQLNEGKNYISKIRRLSESMDVSPDVSPDDLISLWTLSADMMCVLSSDYNILHANEAWSFLGYTAEDLVGSSLLKLVNNDDLNTVRRYLDQHIEAIRLKCGLKNKSGGVINVDISISRCRAGKCYLICRSAE